MSAPLPGECFETPDGDVRCLHEPEGRPTKRQLLWLACHGLLGLRDAPGPELTKRECAAAIDRARRSAA